MFVTFWNQFKPPFSLIGSPFHSPVPLFFYEKWEIIFRLLRQLPGISTSFSLECSRCFASPRFRLFPARKTRSLFPWSALRFGIRIAFIYSEEYIFANRETQITAKARHFHRQGAYCRFGFLHSSTRDFLRYSSLQQARCSARFLAIYFACLQLAGFSRSCFELRRTAPRFSLLRRSRRRH